MKFYDFTRAEIDQMIVLFFFIGYLLDVGLNTNGAECFDAVLGRFGFNFPC